MMSTFPKVGLDALLTPEKRAVLLIDHQRSQLANVNSHDPTLVINNVTALAKTAKAYGVRPRRRVRHCAGVGDGYATGVIELTSGSPCSYLPLPFSERCCSFPRCSVRT